MSRERANGLMGFDVDLGIQNIPQFVATTTEDEVVHIPELTYSIYDILSAIEPRMSDDDINRLIELEIGDTDRRFLRKNNARNRIHLLSIIAEFGQLYRDSGIVHYRDGRASVAEAKWNRLLVQSNNTPVNRYLRDTDGTHIRDANGRLVEVSFTTNDGKQIREYITTDDGNEYLFDSFKGFTQAYYELTQFMVEYEKNKNLDFTWFSSALDQVKRQVDAINDAEVEVEASDEIGYCNNCGRKWLTHALIQTRSGDEALTNKYKCASCKSGKYHLHIYTKEERDAYRAKRDLENAQKQANAPGVVVIPTITS